MSLDVYLNVPACEHCGRSEGSMYDANITHNLGAMASAAGIYQALWRPEEIGVTTAGQLIPLLTEGLAKLNADPETYKQHNPSNGWGSYEGLVRFVTNYLTACHQYPNAIIRISR